jgi:hypothetical protein
MSNIIKKVMIVQPTFLPWMGWFDLLDQIDEAIMLDDVSFAKQSWQQRNRIIINKHLGYVTLPVKTSGKQGQLINEVELDGQRFVKKIIGTIQANYAKSPYFKDYFDSFVDIFQNAAKSGKLLNINIALIRWLMEEIGIQKEIHYSSNLFSKGIRSQKVISLCETLSASQYIAPYGSKDYMIDDYSLFEKKNLDARLHLYRHPDYNQMVKPFVPFASSLDLIMNEGKKSLEIIRSGRRSSIPLKTIINDA